MVDATVSTVVTRVAPIIGQTVLGEVRLLINSTDEANKLASNLESIQKFLMVSEPTRVTDLKVKSWLDKLQEISYEIEDALDVWDYQNYVAHQPSDPLQKVSSFLQSVCLCFRRVFERRIVNSNIKELNEKLDKIAQQIEDEFKFIPNVSHVDSPAESKRDNSTSFVNVSRVHGRDRDKEDLITKLLSEGSSSKSENSVPVISIVGAGGMGKTTLAQLVFNHERIKNHFQVKMWVCVSGPFDEIKIAKVILEELNMKTPDYLSQFQTLLRAIEQAISGKSFLLVLDDVWTMEYDKWEELRVSLNKGDPISRILVTTRNMAVANAIEDSQMQSLDQLSGSDILNIVFGLHDRTKWEPEILEAIVEKCKGLPLAAKALGGLLRSKSGWEARVEVLGLGSQGWESEKIFPRLELSYNELRPEAKRCFSYCAIFPKNFSIDVDSLIRLWCAQGFLSSIEGPDDLETKGRRIFYDLAMRSFFQDFKKNALDQIFSCKIHDIVHDFAQSLTKNECLIVENADGEARTESGRVARHLNLLVDKDKADINPISMLHERCRSFLTTNYAIDSPLLRHLRRVRVLILNDCELEVIPSGIDSSIHLRYLDLSGNPIEKLPETICNLYNLQTFVLDECNSLSALPQGISKLRKLRHIQNNDTPNLEFVEGIEELPDLCTIDEVNALGKNWKNLALLRNLNQLRGFLKISMKSSDYADELVEAAKKANLKNKNVERLMLSYDGKVPSQVMEALQPPSNLQMLIIAGPYLPKWVPDLTKLRQVSVKGKEEELDEVEGHPEMGILSSLNALGKILPSSLEALSLSNISGMERLSRGFLGIDASHSTNAFPKLKRLTFDDCEKWEVWEDISEEEEHNINISIFPSLEKLEFKSCPQLEALPHRLLRKASSLKHLKIYDSHKLHESYKDWQIVSEIHKLTHIPASGVRIKKPKRSSHGLIS